MPDLPVMHIPSVRVIGIVKGTSRGWAGRPVKGLGIVFCQDFGENAFIHEQVISHLRRFCHPAPLIHEHFHLIVAAPQTQGSVMPDSLYIVCKFPPDVFLKLRGQLIDRTGKHKILPDQKSHLIAQFIEPVFRVAASAPDTNDVEVGLPAGFQQFSCLFPAGPAQKMVLRDIICSHGKYGPAV